MWINPGPLARQRYVSWWPQDPLAVPVLTCGPAVPRPPSYDWRAEGGWPSRVFLIANARRRIDEAAMASAWDQWTRVDCYAPPDRNCCTTIAQLLFGAGGARLGHWYIEPLWWDPAGITRFVRLLAMVEPLREVSGLGITPPPETVPRAPASQYFAHMETRVVTG